MFRVVGDVIEYDGKPFAVVTAPLSGFSNEARDALNEFGFLSYDDWDEAISELKSDINQLLITSLQELQTELWLSEEWADVIRDKIGTALEELIKREMYEE